jgi:hypothetical protein
VVVSSDLTAVTLSFAELIRLEEEYGSLEAAAVALPEQRDEILAAAERTARMSERFREAVRDLRPQRASPSPNSPTRLQIPELYLDELQSTQEAMEAALVAVGLGERRRGEPGAFEKEFKGTDVEDVVRMWRLPATLDPPTSQNAIAERTGLSRAAVRRIVRLVTIGALEWDEKYGRGWLGIDGRFPSHPPTISLRALEKARGLAPLA